MNMHAKLQRFYDMLSILNVLRGVDQQTFEDVLSCFFIVELLCFAFKVKIVLRYKKLKNGKHDFWNGNFDNCILKAQIYATFQNLRN